MAKTAGNSKPRSNQSGDKKIHYKGKSQKKINLTPKKKKVPQPIPQKKKTPGFSEPFPVSIEEQVKRINDITRSHQPEKSDLELTLDFVSALKTHLTSKNLNFKSNVGLTNACRVLIITLSSERALELGGVIEDDFELTGNQHPILLSAHGGGRKADQITRQKDAIKKGDIPVAIGTPGRILRLIQEDGLDLTSMSKNGGIVLFDMQYDSKDRDVLGMQETKKDIIPLLSLRQKGLVDALRQEGSKLKLALIKSWDE